MWMINPTSINRDSLFDLSGKSMAVSKKYNLGDLFFKYGLRLENDLVKDLYSAPIVLGRWGTKQFAICSNALDLLWIATP